MRPNSIAALLALLVFVPTTPGAEPQPATIRVPKPSGWVGQRVPFFVELRAAGSFDGAAGFSLPEIPRTVVVPVGNAVVSSEESDGESVFVQTHEFALFSQQSGTLEIPDFEVRFAHRNGFTGPVVDERTAVPATKVEIRRPPGSDAKGFLVTTDSLDVTESWDPEPGSAQPGAVFHRTIAQQADEVTGMALAPPSTRAPEGIRVRRGRPEVSDQTERGAFTGKRTDTITYVLREPGTWTLPAVAYVWWNPERKEFGSKTLPSVTFTITAPPVAKSRDVSRTTQRAWAIAVAVLLVGLCVVAWQHRAPGLWAKVIWRRWNPPDRVAARKLRHACHRNDPVEAEAAWMEWSNTRPARFETDADLAAAVLDLHRVLYGTGRTDDWQGAKLNAAFRRQLRLIRREMAPVPECLPPLNQ